MQYSSRFQIKNGSTYKEPSVDIFVSFTKVSEVDKIDSSKVEEIVVI